MQLPGGPGQRGAVETAGLMLVQLRECVKIARRSVP
jgi:hypothetical protein